ncbi:40S ribosomal protein S2-like [Sciurus carolinensis]|uniref:40S ribosomal protein S2-like n=1 Tax=Sciurus carolinensis TaxID=30640 RepID=UPI001FB4D194|nr:40S ribosomal protein S2-like [Sciurus carolinensis]
MGDVADESRPHLCGVLQHRGCWAHGGKAGDKLQVPFTKLGHLLKYLKVKFLEEICRLSLQNEVLKIRPVKKQICADRQTGIKVFVVIRDCSGHVCLSARFSKEVTANTQEAITLAMLSLALCRSPLPQAPHHPLQDGGHCSSALVNLILACRGTGTDSAPVPKKLLLMAGVEECYTSARGYSATLGNLAKVACIS